MAFAPLSLQEYLRPWFASGLSHLLLDGEFTVDARACAPHSDAASAFSASPRMAQDEKNAMQPHVPSSSGFSADRRHPGAKPGGGAAAAGRGGVVAAAASAQGTGGHAVAGQTGGQAMDRLAAQAATQAVAQAGSPPGSQSARPVNNLVNNPVSGQRAGQARELPQPAASAFVNEPGLAGHGTVQPGGEAASFRMHALESWPHVWQRQFAKAPPRPVVVWTYPTLGHDLLCTPDARRRERLRELLTPLNLPRGSSAFLPCLLPDIPENHPTPDDTLLSVPFNPAPEIFWSAMRMLSPKVLILFGMSALEAVLPGQAMRFYQQSQHYGVHSTLLPDIFDAHAAGPPTGAVAAYLSTALSAVLKFPRA